MDNNTHPETSLESRMILVHEEPREESKENVMASGLSQVDFNCCLATVKEFDHSQISVLRKKMSLQYGMSGNIIISRTSPTRSLNNSRTVSDSIGMRENYTEIVLYTSVSEHLEAEHKYKPLLGGDWRFIRWVNASELRNRSVIWLSVLINLVLVVTPYAAYTAGYIAHIVTQIILVVLFMYHTDRYLLTRVLRTFNFWYLVLQILACPFIDVVFLLEYGTSWYNGICRGINDIGTKTLMMTTVIFMADSSPSMSSTTIIICTVLLTGLWLLWNIQNRYNRDKLIADPVCVLYMACMTPVSVLINLENYVILFLLKQLVSVIGHPDCMSLITTPIRVQCTNKSRRAKTTGDLPIRRQTTSRE